VYARIVAGHHHGTVGNRQSDQGSRLSHCGGVGGFDDSVSHSAQAAGRNGRRGSAPDGSLCRGRESDDKSEDGSANDSRSTVCVEVGVAVLEFVCICLYGGGGSDSNKTRAKRGGHRA